MLAPYGIVVLRRRPAATKLDEALLEAWLWWWSSHGTRRWRPHWCTVWKAAELLRVRVLVLKLSLRV
jgi:hypothetical protein